jgi:hypothetical protein
MFEHKKKPDVGLFFIAKKSAIISLRSFSLELQYGFLEPMFSIVEDLL